MKMRKIRFKSTDYREFNLIFVREFPFSDIVLELHQIDIMRIIKAFEKTHNKTLINKFKKFIEKIDKVENESTDFNCKIARRDIDG